MRTSACVFEIYAHNLCKYKERREEKKFAGNLKFLSYCRYIYACLLLLIALLDISVNIYIFNKQINNYKTCIPLQKVPLGVFLYPSKWF